MFYVGIDPGLTGALGILDDKGRAQVFDTPTLSVGAQKRKGKKHKTVRRQYVLAEMKRLLARFTGQPALAVIELVSARPEQGVTSMWSMGYGVGLWEMALTFAGIPFTRVAPQKWRKIVLEGVRGTDKHASVLRAQQLFPHLNFFGTLGGEKDGRAEALLMAEYARRQHRQGAL